MGDLSERLAATFDAMNRKAEAQAEEIEKLKAEVKRLQQVTNPRLWTQEQDNAWHNAIPDVYAAFEAIRGVEIRPVITKTDLLLVEPTPLKSCIIPKY